MQLFYLEEASLNSLVFLDKDESKHCVKSLRKKMNDTILITNGKGKVFEAKLVNEDVNKCMVEISKEVNSPFLKKYNLHIAISPLKNPDRFEWFVEKAVEIGVDSIIPIICEHTEKSGIKMDRLKRIAVSAMKQSLKVNLPEISNPIKISEFLNGDFNSSQNFIAWCETSKEKLLFEVLAKTQDVVLLIGPEGDFTKTEVDLAIQKGFLPVSLGNSRFRTETAGVLACHTVFSANQ